ncbi:Transporter of the ATP-binding cassette (ABC) [Coemansia sp. RSA 552]|nr:Transporter of the ATP-binding cassette (ABC) [Coemansia sp. RSA 552]
MVSGHIELCDFSVKYRKDLEPALKDINLTVRPGEKIGIVGRTGSGKSTLAKSLFRLAGPHTKGNILIDGQDISAMGVGDLRPCLGIIPQEASMFGGSFKRNLDPLYQYSIEDIWAVLIKCKVAEKVLPKTNGESGRGYDDDYYNQEYEEELEAATRRWNHAGWAMRLALLLLVEKPQVPKKRRVCRHGLNRKVDGSSSFSNGEQQLFSLCRLLMRKRRIIILDEATAEVDLETDGEVQRLIHDEFSHCTILTIAHRLETIMNSDRIVVLDKGRIVEVGPPQQLIERGGHFAHLVKTNEF